MTAKLLLKSPFGIDIKFDLDAIPCLETMEKLIAQRPISVTPELNERADKGL